jgi:hypothetical protein
MHLCTKAVKKSRGRLAPFDREDGMDVDLGVGVGHLLKMSLLTEPGNIFCDGFYKDIASTDLG